MLLLQNPKLERPGIADVTTKTYCKMRKFSARANLLKMGACIILQALQILEQNRTDYALFNLLIAITTLFPEFEHG